MKENTPKNFVIQLGSLISLYVSVSALIVLLFGVINLRFPDEVTSYWADESAREGIRFSIAMLFVFFPIYLWLTRLSNQIRRKEEGGSYTTLAKWLVYLSLLLGGGIITGDLVTILLFFLNGEITVRFILKALALLLVVGATFGYYLYDVRGYFKNRENISKIWGASAALLVATSLIVGFFHIETPAEVREIRLDNQQVSDLQDMQWRIEEYYRIEGSLPSNISMVYEGMRVPTAPSGREEYSYLVTGNDTYQLCATFVVASSNDATVRPSYPKDNYSWDHPAGKKCFDRRVESLDR